MKIFAAFILVGWMSWNAPAFAASAPAGLDQCVSCHRFSPDDPEDKHQGPDLFYAGDQFQAAWLEKFLRSPIVIRKAGLITDPGFLKGEPALSAPHISLADPQAGEMAAYLLSLKLPGLSRGRVDREPLAKGERARIKYQFERTYGCISCHEGLNLVGQVRGGISGPSLANAGLRLQPDWIFHWLKNPKTFLNKGRMPVFDLDDETAVALAKYLMTLKKEIPNAPLESGKK